MADQTYQPPFQFIPRTPQSDFKDRKTLRKLYQYSYFEAVMDVFAPATRNLVFNGCLARDRRLKVEVAAQIRRNLGNAPPEMMNAVKLRTHYEVECILCEEYRSAYFALMNLVGVHMFDLVGDPHQQRDGVLESEDVRLDNMLG